MTSLAPKDVAVAGQDGNERTFVFHKFDAIGGREIIAKYPLSNLPKLGDYEVSKETMLKLMAYVGVRRENGNVLMLTTPALVNNHVSDWECLAKIEAGMLEYNCSFFGNGKNSDLFANIAGKLQAWIISTLTALSAQSSARAKPPLTS